MMRFFLAALLALGLTAGGARAGQTFDNVKARGTLNCGVNVGVAGFSLPDSQGVWRGMDADLCRGLAAVMFGDPAKVRFVPLTAVQRFTALQSGEIDVLIRQTTLTMTRDTTLGLRMVVVNLYDGHGFMVRKDANISDPKEMDGMTICLSPGTTNELVTTDWFRANNLRFTPLLQERMQDNAAALQAGRCDAIGTDATQLAALRSQFTRPGDFVILPQRFSKEPYGPVVRRDDQEWFDVVRWTVSALIQAEELGVTSANAEQLRQSPNPDIRRLLGTDPVLGQALKLDPAWAYNLIRAIGNYGELFDRTIGPKTPIGLERGLNRLWTDGGLMYSWPMR
ncbi:amino acid ABC transporter substrate-binding protein [Siccirubricoccus sp. KC 17139]|uniref:Amino acid ABC transporter substrate-binding protein n=1 Tax=Siccirubricoccus soli TaxID=2899147 RepID=A0ABT1D537_9PROT|nr:amino acid ABC transporter substrate-binding protein [Siccirubricoccus soli]MCO6417028.1 amino acid ABC transporter substrate-binding protein [Siccirubricoccus soli]MCP2683163.1 amino acid ABC transporter substrate-binding protein [Siccirubricoccus soli]